MGRAGLLAGMALALSAATAVAQPTISDAVCRKVWRSAQGAGALGSLPFEGPITVVAIGSSSTAGIAGNDRSMLYPAALEAALQAERPGATVVVHNKGVGGETLPETLARFERDVFALRPHLVVWQLGVNDALRAASVADRWPYILEGLRQLAARDIPVILLDLQLSPATLRAPATADMQKMIGDAAARGPHRRVLHIKRFDAMKRLAEDEGVPMSAMVVSDGLHMTDAMHRCIGRLLAMAIARSAIPIAGETSVP